MCNIIIEQIRRKLIYIKHKQIDKAGVKLTEQRKSMNFVVKKEGI